MRISFVLILGILTPIIAQDYYVQIFGYTNVTIEDIEKFDKNLCEKNGGTKNHEAHKLSRELFDNCTESLDYEIYVEVEKARRYPGHRGDNFVYGSYCRRVAKYENCMKNFTDSMKSCLDVDKHESADIIYNIVSKILRFLCENGADRLTKITSDQSHQCILSQHSTVMDCANRTIIKYAKTIISDGAEVGGLGKLHLLVPDYGKCSIFNEFQQCAVKELKNCSTAITSEIVNAGLDIIKNVANCDHWLNSNASPAVVVIVSLITISTVIAMLYFAYNYMRTRKNLYTHNSIFLKPATSEEDVYFNDDHE